MISEEDERAAGGAPVPMTLWDIGENGGDNMSVRPFRAAIPEAALDDLQARLERVRWPNQPAAAGWEYGTNLDYMRELVAYWRDGFDWRAAEAALNRFPQFVAELDGEQVHFIHERGSGPDPLALIITHGWPGSVFEFLEVIEPLAHPERFGGAAADGFDVVVPSLPGYGFSAPPPGPVTPRAVAGLWHPRKSTTSKQECCNAGKQNK